MRKASAWLGSLLPLSRLSSKIAVLTDFAECFASFRVSQLHLRLLRRSRDDELLEAVHIQRRDVRTTEGHLRLSETDEQS